jgi:hypothetical protein
MNDCVAVWLLSGLIRRTHCASLWTVAA